MLSPAVSPVMVGRSRDLEALREAQRRSVTGSPRGVLVLGEAGIGKTRLLRDFVTGLDDEIVVATGQCVAPGTVPVPLQPIRGLLRDLLAQFETESVRSAVDASARLLPAALTGGAGGPDAITHEQLHEAVPALLEGISTLAPLVLIVEDVHWADTASVDVLRGLLRSLRRGRCLIVLTHRSDEAHQDHPSRPFILELERARDVTRIELRRLTLEETAAQASAIRGDAPDPEALATLFARSEGVPFYVEELLAVDQVGALPETLRELLLARYSTLSPAAQAAVRLIAAGGVRVEHRLVEQVHDGNAEAFDRAIRASIAARLLRTEHDAYRFRHALIHEAVLDELLPGERRRLHARYAQALEAETKHGARHAEIAHHWQAAGDAAHALAALLPASREALAAGAPFAAAELGQQALALWPLVPDAEQIAGCARSQLLLEVGSALESASDPRALELLERAIDEVPETDRRGRALLLHQAMLVRNDAALDGALDLGRRAIALLPEGDDDEAQLVRLHVVIGVGTVEALNHEPTARGRLEQCIELARALVARVGDAPLGDRARLELARGLSPYGLMLATGGDVDVGLATLAEARLCGTADVETVLTTHMYTGWLLHHLGRHRESLRFAQEARASAISSGMALGAGATFALLGAWSNVALGALDEVSAAVRVVREVHPPFEIAAYGAALEAELLLLRDDPRGAAAALSRTHQAIDDPRSMSETDDLTFARIHAELALADGDSSAAWTAVAPLWRRSHLEPGPAFALLGAGARTLARLRRKSIEPPGTTTVAASERLLRALDEVSVWDVAGDWRALIEADLADDDVLAWQTARLAASRGRVPLRLHVHALQRLAEAHVRSGDRDAAAVAIDEAATIAHRSGLLEAARLVEALATRARLRARRHRPHDGSTLTDRERQVLGLIAQGLTNRQIGDSLFISAKTVSVHVSAILRKLGGSTRAEVAARASDIL